MEIRGDIRDFHELTKGIKAAEPALRRASVSALNKTGRSYIVQAGKLISKHYAVTQKAVKAELALSKAHFRRLKAIVRGAGSPGIPLYKFRPSPRRIPSTVRTKTGRYTPPIGISVMVTRGARKKIRGAFIATMRSGHVGVFRRKEGGTGNWWDAFSGKQKIEELYGPSPLRLIEQDRFQIPLDDFAGDTLEKNMDHEAEYFLKKFKVIPNA